MIDISRGNTLKIENAGLLSDNLVFIGGFTPYDEKHGHSVKVNLYGKSKVKYSANMIGGNVTIDFIDEISKEKLRDFFRNQNEINIIDENNDTYNNLNFIDKRLEFQDQVDVDGNYFYTTSFEVRR